jgi:hypothetical protein
MTALVAWLGVDERKPSSLYLASDSRITYQDEDGELVDTWDHGQKLFVCARMSDMLGYAGAVPFPSQVLARMAQQIDCGVFGDQSAAGLERATRVYEALKREHDLYPSWQRQKQLDVIYATREGEGNGARFCVYQFPWSSSNGWVGITEHSMPCASGIVVSIGSGDVAVRSRAKRWRNAMGCDVSRSVFGALCDALADGRDTTIGGPPQLVGLYPKGPPNIYGVIYDGRRWLCGGEVLPPYPDTRLEWRNELLERCDPKTGQLLAGAQRQPRPSGLRP